MRIFIATLSLAMAAFAADKAVTTKVESLGVAQMDTIYRLRLDKDALLLESILDFIKQNNIQDGAVLTAAGSIDDCTVHGVGGKMRHFPQPTEIDALNGIIAAGEPHLHVVLSNESGAVGGHLEKNCRVLSHVELTLARFSGPKLERKKSELRLAQ